jgi:uracil-DNA glycosylase
MRARRTAAEFIPARSSLSRLRTIAAGCTACELYKRGTQTVFGEGRSTARVVLVGEQPGDQEDLAGKPFVGPAGKLLDRALVKAGIDRGECYITNIVKHFKWEPRGKRRIHKKPNQVEISACKPWFEAEIAALQPAIIICLGATAAQAILGRAFKVTAQRGHLFANIFPNAQVMATVHPSSILRAPDDVARHEAIAQFVKDLQMAQKAIGPARNQAA